MAKTSFAVCDTCGNIYKSQKCLTRHSVIHKERVQLICPGCNTSKFPSKLLLKSHLKNCYDKYNSKNLNIFACNTCGECFFKKNTLGIHRLKHLPTEIKTVENGENEKNSLIKCPLNHEKSRTFENRDKEKNKLKCSLNREESRTLENEVKDKNKFKRSLNSEDSRILENEEKEKNKLKRSLSGKESRTLENEEKEKNRFKRSLKKKEMKTLENRGKEENKLNQEKNKTLEKLCPFCSYEGPMDNMVNHFKIEHVMEPKGGKLVLTNQDKSNSPESKLETETAGGHLMSTMKTGCKSRKSEQGRFVCNDCGKNFVAKRNLKRHSLTHTGREQLTYYHCYFCNSKFTRKDTLIRHFKISHGGGASPQKAYKCEPCGEMFTKKVDLRHHILNHLSLSFICNTCGKEFKKKFLLARHLNREKCHERNFLKRCPLCQYEGLIECLLNHFRTDHDIELKITNLLFQNMNDFYSWKTKVETETNTKFILSQTDRGKRHIKFACHRSGYYKRKGKGLRPLKKLGSNKINGYCPARIHFKLVNDTVVSVKFQEIHVGHGFELERIIPVSTLKRLKLKTNPKYMVIESEENPEKTQEENIFESFENVENAGLLNEISCPKNHVTSAPGSIDNCPASLALNNYVDGSNFNIVENHMGHDFELGEIIPLTEIDQLNIGSEINVKTQEVYMDDVNLEKRQDGAIIFKSFKKPCNNSNLKRNLSSLESPDPISSCPDGVENNVEYPTNVNLIESHVEHDFELDHISLTGEGQLNSSPESGEKQQKLVNDEDKIERRQEWAFIFESFNETENDRSLQEKVRNLKSEVLSLLDLITNMDQFEAIQKIVNSIHPVIKPIQGNEILPSQK